MRSVLTLVAALSLSAAIWFGLLWLNDPVLTDIRVRLGLIAAVMGGVVLITLVGIIRRRRAAKALERSLMQGPGDAAILAERMQDALGKLKKRGGATYLYDLPWYVIIGPPGAGKTTALVHSGLSFPGTDQASISGFGGTRNCDFWFAENAVLVDTAGRYTTQDSDAQADHNSWIAFLNQLKRARPNQPVNGVMLAFSCEDMAHWDDARLAAHAKTVRQRLEELHERLRVDVPVYVIFTKADKIVGFREFFASFDEMRRRKVWGATFQTRRKKDQTWQQVPQEFDALLSRLSAEVTDRLNEEPDPTARIAIFGFPGQMAMLQEKASDFLRRVFENPRGTSAYLRGFYFTSGTQQGTPIDQVLGAMAESSFAMGGQAGFLSGRGKSFFLHELLNDVIFPEQNWVGYDRRARRIRSFFRGLAKIVITVTSVTAIAVLGYSFWQNATLVRKTEAQMDRYDQMLAQRPVLSNPVIADPNPAPVLPALSILRNLPAGYGDRSPETVFETVGLSRREGVRQAAIKAYSDALERHLRPRLMLHFENTLPQLVVDGELGQAYRALRVYLLLAKQQPGKDQDDVIRRYFAEIWNTQLRDADIGPSLDHLAAMLDLDGRVTPRIPAQQDIVDPAQQALAALPRAERIYGAILSEQTRLPRFELRDAMRAAQPDLVFDTRSGAALETLSVPGFYTYDGFWARFMPALTRAPALAGDEPWVLGQWLGSVEEDDAALTRDVATLYRQGFAEAWDSMLADLMLRPHSEDDTILRLLASDSASPLTALAEAVTAQTHLSRDPARAVPGGAGARIAELVEQPLDRWHALLRPDPSNRVPVLELAQAYGGLLEVVTAAVQTPDPDQDATRLNAALARLMQPRTRYPATIQRMIGQTDRAFSAFSVETRLREMEQALRGITGFCTRAVAGHAPLDGGGPPLPLNAFQAFFGPGGQMETYFNRYLAGYVIPDAERTLVPDRTHPVGARISDALITQFAQANRIRAAFFPNRSPRPRVPFGVELSGPASDAQMLLGARILGPDSGPAQVIWPAQTRGPMTLSSGGESLSFDGPWALTDFIRRGAVAVQDERTMLVTYTLGGQSVQVRLMFGGDVMPFLMPELAEFTCPDRVQ